MKKGVCYKRNVELPSAMLHWGCEEICQEDGQKEGQEDLKFKEKLYSMYKIPYIVAGVTWPLLYFVNNGPICKNIN